MSHKFTRTIATIALTGCIASLGLLIVPSGASAAASTKTQGTAKTAPGQPKFGEKGDNVKAVQNAILGNGFTLTGGATGNFDKTTLRALKTFQKVVGLHVTGVVDAPTAKVLKISTAPITTQAPTATVAPITTIAAPTTTAAPQFAFTSTSLPVRGAKGDAVFIVQRALVAHGQIVKGGVDGAFGSGTTATVVNFQKSVNIPATGLLDIATASALGLIAPVSPTTATEVPTVSAASATEFLPAGSLPKRGDRGKSVALLQKALTSTGVELKGGVDGVFGGATFVAIQKFQATQNLSITGVLDSPTALKLGLIAAPVVQISVFPVQGSCSYTNTWNAPRGTSRLHQGVDIIAAEGKLLYAVADGVITKMYTVGSDKLAGNGVRITMADGTYFFYGHMLRIADGISIGVAVKAGQVVGYVGKTGNTNTPHLHFEVHPLGGRAVDPTPVVAAVDACGVTNPLPIPVV